MSSPLLPLSLSPLLAVSPPAFPRSSTAGRGKHTAAARRRAGRAPRPFPRRSTAKAGCDGRPRPPRSPLRPPARKRPRRSARPDSPATANPRPPALCDRRTARCEGSPLPAGRGAGGEGNLLPSPTGRGAGVTVGFVISAASNPHRSSPHVAAPSLNRNRSGGEPADLAHFGFAASLQRPAEIGRPFQGQIVRIVHHRVHVFRRVGDVLLLPPERLHVEEQHRELFDLVAVVV